MKKIYKLQKTVRTKPITIIERVAFYVTEDGMEFINIRQAELHQEKINSYEAYYSMLYGIFPLRYFEETYLRYESVREMWMATEQYANYQAGQCALKKFLKGKHSNIV